MEIIKAYFIRYECIIISYIYNLHIFNVLYIYSFNFKEILSNIVYYITNYFLYLVTLWLKLIVI